MVCYADDTNILITEKNENSLKNTAEIIYRNIILWSNKNQLNLNTSKTKTILFSLRPGNTNVTLFENTNDCLASSSESKMLGLVFDQGIKWCFHIEQLCARLRSGCYALNFLSKQCSQRVQLTLYYSNIHSHIRYGILNWGSSSQVNRVFLLQKYAVRIMATLSYRESCRKAFRELKILTVAGTYIFECCVFVFKNRNDFFNTRVTHTYNTRTKELLLPATHSTALFQKSVFYNECRFFNALTPEIKKAPNIYIFKRRLKVFLINKNCYTIQEFFS